MPAITDHPIKLTTARFILRSLRFCFLRCFSTRSACSGVKSEDIRVAVLSSSVGQLVRTHACDQRAGVRTFAGLQKRVSDGYGDETGKGNDKVGEELSLHKGQYTSYYARGYSLPLHRMCSLSRTFWGSVQRDEGH
jgi:hypothetical protein